ncbi:serine protease grass-like [Drosophila elegans]|uniref:serine protease grass-like n=1 Tax=Drosophila elegans TaxID=30023 RepID=UPI0007E68BA3|nr:serine protease grass-like [Drosophila elegans]
MVLKVGIAVIACLFLWTNEGSADLLEKNCGTTKRLSRFKRVVGGQDAEIFSNPWMVILLKDLKMICGGTLITSRFVLTAANCDSPSKVRLGEYDRESSEDCSPAGCIQRSYDVDIERLISHSLFGKNLGDFKHDIALVKLAQEVEFSDSVRPICLLVNEQVGRTPTSFNVTGWGKTDGDGNGSRILQTATLSNINLKKCIDYFGMEDLDESQICAGSSTADTCTGDSGAPLTAELIYGKIPRVFQFGIASFGAISCDGTSVYTNVTHYINWITSTIDQN